MQYLFSVPGKRFFQIGKRKSVHEKKSGNVPVSKIGEEPAAVYRDEFVTLSFDSEKGVLYQEWIGFCPGAEFRASIDYVFRFMKEKNIYKTVCDVRHQRVVPPSGQKYVEEKVLSFINSRGLFYTAFVALEKSAGGISAKLYDIHITQKLNYKINSFFDNISEAELWLSGK